MLSNRIMAMSNVSDAEITKSIAQSLFIVDYGRVSKVYGEGLVDVTHSVLQVTTGDEVLDANVTYAVEVLFPSSAAFSMRHTVAVGDPMLLVGLKQFLPTVASTEPAKPDAFFHYSQETIKALPLSLHNEDASVIIEESEGKLRLLNQVQSLKLLMDELIGVLENWTSMPCAVGSPTTPSVASLASMTTIKIKFAALLKE